MAAVKCRHCGEYLGALAAGMGYPQMPVQKRSGLAIASLVCGIVSPCCCGVATGGVAIGLGIAAKRKIAAGGGRITGGAMATWGIALGIFGVVAHIVTLVLQLTGVVQSPFK